MLGEVRKMIEWHVDGRKFVLTTVQGRTELQTAEGQLLDLFDAEWRMIASALAELNLGVAPRRKSLPARAGQPWSAGEDDEVREFWKNGKRVGVIAANLQRTYGSISTRLERLGLVSQRDRPEVHQPASYPASENATIPE